MQSRLFDIEPFIDTEHHRHKRELLENRYPVLRALELELNSSDPDYRLIRVSSLLGARMLYPSWNQPRYVTQPDEPMDDYDDSQCGWYLSDSVEKNVTGFLKGAYSVISPLDYSPILHIATDRTDVDEARVGIFLDEIDEIEVFSEDAKDVFEAYQNALVDNSTFYYQEDKGLPTDTTITLEEIIPYVTTYWPEPTTIYSRGEK